MDVIVAPFDTANPGAIGGTTPAAITGTTITANTAFATGSAAATRTSAANLGFRTKLATWGVPVFMAPSGTMGNNGAVTLGTALDRTYSEGFWLYFPAGAVAAGVPSSATFLWTVMSSTTAGTVYNSSFDGSGVPVAGTTTAYSTTGPGAYTGVTTIVTAITVTVSASTLGSTGMIEGNFGQHHTGAAGNKTFGVFYSGAGGTDYGSVGSTQSGGTETHVVIRNNGTGAQSGGTMANYNGGALASGLKFGAADTTAQTTLVFRMTNATATNWMGIVGGDFFTNQ